LPERLLAALRIAAGEDRNLARGIRFVWPEQPRHRRNADQHQQQQAREQDHAPRHPLT
jgi:hypothetical protein